MMAMVRMVIMVVLMFLLLPNSLLQRMLLFLPSLLTTELHRGAKFWLVAGMGVCMRAESSTAGTDWAPMF